MNDDVESYSPVGGNVSPSRMVTRSGGQSRGESVDSLFRKFDREDAYREAAKLPVSERKAFLKAWRESRKQKHE